MGNSTSRPTLSANFCLSESSTISIKTLNERVGEAILLYESVPFSPLSPNSHAVATFVHLKCPFTLCSIYLAPSCTYVKADLIHLLAQLPKPVLILGDFNLRHPLSGDSGTSSDTDWLIDCMHLFALSYLNSGLLTHERLDTRSSTCVDVSLCFLSILDKFLWERSSFLCGSDHYTILTSLSPTSPPSYSAWRYDCADWSLFG